MFYFFLVFSLIFGTMIGSFLNCLVWRLYQGEGMWSRSHCPKCKKMISWYDNIPLFSFIALGAKCRYCRKPISWQYPMAELGIGLLFAFVFFYRFIGFDDLVFIDKITSLNLDTVLLLRDWIIVSFLSAIFIMDFKWYVVADEISLPAIVVVFLMNLGIGMTWPLLASGFVWQKLVLAVIVGAGVFAVQYFGSGGRWVGGGDIRIGALMGAALGWPGVLVALALAYGIGALASIYLIVIKRKQSFSFKHLWQPEPTEATIMPFGPFLAIGTVIAMFYGEVIMNWYLSIML